VYPLSSENAGLMVWIWPLASTTIMPSPLFWNSSDASFIDSSFTSSWRSISRLALYSVR
jgi:hypothetical protein